MATKLGNTRRAGGKRTENGQSPLRKSSGSLLSRAFGLGAQAMVDMVGRGTRALVPTAMKVSKES